MHIKHDLSIAHIFCSVLQLSKQQKPQNSEAVTYIIAKASRPICKHPIVETTKPPTYLFRFPSMSKSVETTSWRRSLSHSSRRFPNFRFVVSGRFARPASASRRFRFGEEASRPGRQKPQGQKSGNPRKIHKIFAEALVSLTYFLRLTGVTGPEHPHHGSLCQRKS